MANLHEPEFDPGREWPQGYDGRFARIGAQAGAERLGATLYEVPPGNALCPYHWHAGNEEMLILLEGTATLRMPDGERELLAGDVVAFPVGEQGAHKVTNASTAPARLLIVSEMNAPDLIVYPDSDKVMARQQAPGTEATGLRSIFRLADHVDYFEGEIDGKAP
jgi:uncharacterized cupin superfamily protein